MGDVTTSVAFHLARCLDLSVAKCRPLTEVDLLKLFKDVPPSVPAPAPAERRAAGDMEAPGKMMVLLIENY